MTKKATDAVMSLYISADTPWRPNQFWAVDLLTADWKQDDFDRARIAQIIADDFLWRMIPTR